MIELNSFDDVMTELRERRAGLLEKVALIQGTIELMERNCCQRRRPRAVEDLSAPLTLIGGTTGDEKPSVRFTAKPKVRFTITAEPKPENGPITLEPGSTKPEEPTQAMTIGQAVLLAAGEAKYGQIQLMDRVCEIRPGTNRASVQVQISTYLRERRIHKGNDFAIRLVKDGVIQGLTKVDDASARLVGRMGQYGV